MSHAARLILAIILRQVHGFINEEMDTKFSKYTCLGICVYSQVQGKKKAEIMFFKYFSDLCLGSFEEDLCEIQWWAGDLTWETGLEVLFDTISGKVQTKVNFANPS